MADRQRKPSLSTDAGVSTVELIALILSVGWMAAVGLFFIFLPPAAPDGSPVDSLRIVLILIAIFMPVAMIWVAVIASKSSRTMREESQRLQQAIDGLRQTYVADRAESAGAKPTVEKKLNEIAQAARKTESALATFASSRQVSAGRADIAAQKQEDADQPALALGTTAEDMAPPLSRPDMVRALNFPDNEQDTMGFSALRRALKNPQARALVQASQDVLTLMSQDGIYMDDLRPDRARPEVWRRFAQGERGRPMAALGGVRDRSSLALTAGRMREDPVFRDAVHHFLRLFDKALVSFEPEATDEDLVALSETRTARAFMLLGRVTGAFD